MLGSWELAATALDRPVLLLHAVGSGSRLVDWFTDGTAQGSIWEQIPTRWTRPCSASPSAWPAWCSASLLGRSRFLADVWAPFIKARNAIPRIVLASIFVIWFGLGLSSKVASAFVLVFFPVFFNAFQGAREVDRNLVDNARILGASGRRSDARRHAQRHLLDPHLLHSASASPSSARSSASTSAPTRASACSSTRPRAPSTPPASTPG